MRTIGDRLKEQRQRAGLTQAQAAELEGCHVNTYGN